MDGPAAELGLGHIVDFVPNHMGIDDRARNLRWRDVLENGPSSPAAHFFDIDWTPIKAALHVEAAAADPRRSVRPRARARRAELAFRDGLLLVSYFEHELPINPKHVPSVLRLRSGR